MLRGIDELLLTGIPRVKLTFYGPLLFRVSRTRFHRRILFFLVEHIWNLYQICQVSYYVLYR